MNQTDIVYKFESEVNKHNCDGIISLLSRNHTIIDPIGNTFNGKKMIQAYWSSYFKAFPKYAVKINEVIINSTTGVAFGTKFVASNGLPIVVLSQTCYLPFVWKFSFSGNKIQTMHIFHDTKLLHNTINQWLK